MEQSDDKGLNEIFEKHEKPVKPEGLTRDEGLKKKRQNNAQHIALRVARKAQLDADCPSCSISLEGPPEFSLKQGSYGFHATLFYKSDPSGQDRPIVLPRENGPLRKHAADGGYPRLYSVYSSAHCNPETRLPCIQNCVIIRRARGPGGRFLPWPLYDISAANGFVELAPGQSVSNKVVLTLKGRSPWGKYLECGMDYWLRCDVPHASSGGAHVGKGWRYGKLKDYEHIQADWADDEKSSIVPLAPSNPIKFRVVE